MIIKKIAVIALTFICLNLFAQKHLIGLKSGVNFSNIYNDNSDTKYEYQTGLSGGLTHEYFFKKNFSLGLDFMYNERGYKRGIYPTLNNGTPTGEKLAENYNNNYFSVPIKVGYTFGKKMFGFVYLGLCPSLLLNAKASAIYFDQNGNNRGSETKDFTERVLKVDLAILSEAGLGYKLKNKYYFYTSISNQRSFGPIYITTYSSNEEIKHFGYIFSVGVKVSVGKQ
jgi:hypothetical protein